MDTAEIPHWAMSKEDQKRELERHLRGFLNPEAGELAPHERFFLAETIGLTMRGLFGMARAAMNEAYEDASLFTHYAMNPDVLARATPSNLRHALRCLENTPARERPVFR
jgi:hypothetical protein